MFTTIITDCRGENEKSRQIARYNSLRLGPAGLMGVSSDFSKDATIEGGADIVDILDASEGKEGVVVLNVAPRGNKRDGGNGTHFSYFYFQKTLVISTIKGYCLSFIKKFGLVKSVNVVDLNTVLKYLHKKRLIDNNLKDYIVKSQFRSFDFVPRLARWLINGTGIPSKTLDIKTISLPPSCIWHIDAFGNAKLSVLSNEVKLFPGQRVRTNFGQFKYYERLKDIPFGESAIYTGSSGLNEKRFLEIASQAIEGSAAKTLDLKVGDNFEIK